ncbi:hypothetical protein L3Q82_011454 [Scortum barcoo]|uniref:Uncharacterized protein n=1 Tax=Scortum barcoo TaxID=214431 RepID=A0ACB8WA96_9TELE|nr:hypothetical protein L3Q82_011454 [Scortum barcoo]
MKKESTRTAIHVPPGLGVTGAPPWSQAWGWGSQAQRLVAGSLPTGPGRAQPEMATWARLPVGSPPAQEAGGEAGVGLLIAPQLSRHVLEFTPVNERVASLRLWVGDRSLAVVCAYGMGRTAVQSTLAFLESLGGVLDSAPTGDSIVLLGGTSTLTWVTTVIPGGA